jgi:hypothetical protein
MRSGAAILPPRRNTRIESCSSPAMPTVAATASAANCGDERDVEQERRERGQREAGLRVHQRHHHRDRAGEGEIGQHHPGIVDGELQGRLSGKARRQHGDDEGHQQADQRGCDNQGRADGAEHAPGKGRCRDRALGLAQAQPGRHQRRVQRAFRQQPPDHVDQLKRHQEGVRDRAGAEQRRDHRIARESEQPRGQRSRRYREERADHEDSSTVFRTFGSIPVSTLNLILRV